MNTGPSIPSSALNVGWHPNNLEADLDLLRAELDACVAEIARLKSALPECPPPPEKGCYCHFDGPDDPRLCAYHQGFEDGWEALREAVEK